MKAKSGISVVVALEEVAATVTPKAAGLFNIPR